MKPEFKGFYFITDSGYTRQGAAKDVECAVRGGAAIVQYREKNKPHDEMLEEAKALLSVCRKHGIPLIINDELELALEIGADGVHLGPHDIGPAEARERFPKGILGISCSTEEEAKAAEAAGADYIAASPVFFTPTKSFEGYSMPSALGLEGISALRKATELPLAAIGGINLGNAREVVLAGADMLCAISATVGTPDVEASVREFIRAIAQAR